MKLLSLRSACALLTAFACVLRLLCAADTSAESVERPLRLQLYYMAESNSSYMQTLDNFDDKRPPRIIEPITLWYASGKNFQRIQVRPGQRSSLITLWVGKDAVFYRSDPTGMETISPDLMVRIPVATDIQQGLVLMRQDNLSASAMIDTSQSRIPVGSVRVINQSRQQIAVKMGADISPLASGGSTTFRPKPDSEDGSTKLLLASMNKQKGWGIFYSTTISPDILKRMLVMVYTNPENPEALKVRVMSIPG